jgi:hypothetical protein
MRHDSRIARAFLLGALAALSSSPLLGPAHAQLIPLPPDQLPGSQPPAAITKPAASPSASSASLATVSTTGVSLSGSLSVANGRATIGNDGTVTAGDKTAVVSLTRGGNLRVCTSTKIHLSTDKTVADGSGALMIALDRGALEAHYTPGQYSDVLLTPDLRILISGPGQADLSLRVNDQGDTCLDNHGDQAPYVLASSLFEGGAYRVQPNQRVLFEHGSVSQVVDNEQDPCGCPPDVPASVADAGTTGANPAKPGEQVAPPSAAPTPAPNTAAVQNPFPLAESEGLQPPPAPPTTPVVPDGTTHVQITAPIVYDANHPEAPPRIPQPADNSAEPTPVPTSAIHVETAQAPPAPQKPHPGFFHHIGHFFKKMFGG